MRFLVRVWGIAWGICIPFFIWRISCVVMVLLAYGISGYLSGLRVVWARPLHFSNGVRVSPNDAAMALIVTFFGMLLIAILPQSLLRRQPKNPTNSSISQT
jgi:hypothetical protein